MKTKKAVKSNTRILAEVVVFVAMATVLHNIKLYQFPNGGAITLGAMVPIFILSLRRGPLVGTYAGIVFGFVVMVFEPFLVSPVQVLLDYPLAFGALGLAGFFRRWRTVGPLIGVSVGIGARFVAHFLAGVFFFYMYAGSLDPITYSIIYNGSYLLPELVISLAIMVMLVMSAKSVFNYGVETSPKPPTTS